MKKIINRVSLLAFLGVMACADNTLETKPDDNKFPLQLVLDAEEGSDLPEAEDYSLEVTFADYLPDQSLPDDEIVLMYSISDLEGDMPGAVSIDKVVYEVDIEDCVYERELQFTIEDDLTGTIFISADEDLESVPESFEIVFTLPGLEGTEGAFVFKITGIETNDNLILGSPLAFEYEVLENDVAGEWELTIATAEEFDTWKEIFSPVSGVLEDISFDDITGKITAEFEFEEMKWIIELKETEEITVCEDGETETEIENKVIEIEAEYEAEDGELIVEGSHVLIGDDGEPEDELDFILEAEYVFNEETNSLQIKFYKLIDEDNYEEGEELFRSESGYLFELSK